MARDKYGLYRGVITEVRDPKKLGRVKVRVPQVLGQATSTWGEYATAPQRVPKVGDKVFVNFLGGDTRYPIWRQIVATKDVGTFTDLVVTGTATINKLDVTGMARFEDVVDLYGVTVFHDDAYFDFPAVFNGTARFEGNATFNNPVSFTDPATFTGTTNLNGAVNFAGAPTVPGITVNGAANLNGAVNFVNAPTVPGITVNGATVVNAGATVQGALTVNGALNANGGIVLPGGQWIKRGNMTGMTMQAGWGYYGGGYQNPAYMEFPDRTAGIVGATSAGTVSTTATEVTISNLPAGIRPADDHVFLCAAEAGNYTQIVVKANGNVVQRRASSGTIGWVAFGNCRWPMNGF